MNNYYNLQPDLENTGVSKKQTSPIMIVAFEGWNDAAEVATGTLDFLNKTWDAKKIITLDSENYYDLQFTRPTLSKDISGKNVILWPKTQIFKTYVADLDTEIFLVRGVEPSYRWRSFTEELLAHVKSLNISKIFLLGSLLADVPHTRVLPVNATSPDTDINKKYDLEESTYEGSIGIIGVLSEFAAIAGVIPVSLWAAVPHYVAQSPSPKSQLALLNRLEDFLNITFPLDQLQIEATEWEKTIDDLALKDPEIAEYVKELEEAKDTIELPRVTGELIAKEFERYLKRRGKK